MANDLAGRVDKLSEAVGVLSERIARVEHEQRATRSSVDQLSGEVRQLDKRLGDFDTRLGDLDTRLGEMSHQFAKRLALMDKRIIDVKWLNSLGMGCIIRRMSVYRFVKLTPGL